MIMSEEWKCPKCRQVAIWGLSDHRCPPAWKATDWRGETVATVYGPEAADAAEFYAERVHEWEDEDVVEVSVLLMELAVYGPREGDEPREWIHLTVAREMEPSYSATIKDGPPAGWTEPEAGAA